MTPNNTPTIDPTHKSPVLASSPSNEQFSVSVTLQCNGRYVNTHAMIDSGAMYCFIHTDFVKEHGFPKHCKPVPIEVQTVDGRPISSGLVTHDTSLNMAIGQHTEDITLNITSLGHYPIILGMPWLSLHNPTID